VGGVDRTRVDEEVAGVVAFETRLLDGIGDDGEFLLVGPRAVSTSSDRAVEWVMDWMRFFCSSSSMVCEVETPAAVTLAMVP